MLEVKLESHLIELKGERVDHSNADIASIQKMVSMQLKKRSGSEIKDITAFMTKMLKTTQRAMLAHIKETQGYIKGIECPKL